jgi:hypothetical protein
MDTPAAAYAGAVVDWIEDGDFAGYAVMLDDGSLEPPVMPIPSAFEINNPSMSIEARLYFAAFIACPKDLGRLDLQQRKVYFDREPPAKRVARAVARELKAIKKGAPPPTATLVGLVASLNRR